MMPLVELETHGCKLNTADSQQLAAEFLRAGFTVRDRENQLLPDVYILNSCTVTHVADKKARQSISAAKRRYPNALTVMTGCYPERAADEIADLHSVDLVLGNSRKSVLVEAVAERLGVSFTPCADGRDLIPPPALLGRTRASVKIQEGCDQVCAYCIVPKVRGRERSVAVEEIVEKVRRLDEAGCREVVFTGTQLGHYGFDLEDGVDLTHLLLAVLNGSDIPRIRVSSLQPPEINRRLLDLWNEEGIGRLCPHFHMPLQSGSDEILLRMRRTYSSDHFLEKVDMIRSRVEGCGITTDVIAGFPGESEADHVRTRDVMQSAEFADAHVFPYSSRPGTSADHFQEQVRPEDKARRAKELRDIAGESSKRFRDSMIGAVRPVLWEGSRGSSGLTDNYIKVRMEAPNGSGAGDGLMENVELVRSDADGRVFVRPV